MEKAGETVKYTGRISVHGVDILNTQYKPSQILH
jgi:hypothetical protein